MSFTNVCDCAPLSVVIVQVCVAMDVGDRVLRLVVVFCHLIDLYCYGCAIVCGTVVVAAAIVVSVSVVIHSCWQCLKSTCTMFSYCKHWVIYTISLLVVVVVG